VRLGLAQPPGGFDDPAVLRHVRRIAARMRVGFRDALIVASAAKAGAKRLLSEDLNAGQTIAGVVIENPFTS